MKKKKNSGLIFFGIICIVGGIGTLGYGFGIIFIVLGIIFFIIAGNNNKSNSNSKPPESTKPNTNNTKPQQPSSNISYSSYTHYSLKKNYSANGYNLTLNMANGSDSTIYSYSVMLVQILSLVGKTAQHVPIHTLQRIYTNDSDFSFSFL